MLDFTSARYLGFRHPHGTLDPWRTLTMGRPAALCEPPLARTLERKLAKLVGLERAVMGSSSLHLFWDVFGHLSQDWVVLVDAEVYPVAQWGAERAAGRGVKVVRFPHHDAEGLEGLLRRHRGRRPLVVTDGYCPLCGQAAPLRAYLEALRRYGGLLLLDDTQALGVLGARLNDQPYGRRGGGSLPYGAVSGEDILLVASFAKGFGVPVAALAGSRHNLDIFKCRSETRVHCSPPSNAALVAARRALALNEHSGDALRRRLASLVHFFRKRLGALGFLPGRGSFPVQSLVPVNGLDVATLHKQLLRRGVRAVLQKGHAARPQLSFLITAQHTRADLEYVSETLRDLSAKQVQRPLSKEVNYVWQP